LCDDQWVTVSFSTHKTYSRTYLRQRSTSKSNRSLGPCVVACYFKFPDFLVLSQNCEKRLLASSCLSVLSSAGPSAWNNSGPTARIFLKFDIIVFFENLSRKFKFHENRTRITGSLHGDQYTFLIISHSIILRMRNIAGKNCKGIKTRILCSITFFSKILPFVR
jgi:hypothetical protein